MADKEQLLYKELQLLYEASGIPMYLCRDGVLIQTFPGSAAAYGLPEALAEDMSEIFRRPLVMMNKCAVYGRMPLSDFPGDLLIAGPVAAEPYTRKDLQDLCRNYQLNYEGQITFVTFLGEVPQMSLSRMAGLMRLIHHVTNRDLPEMTFDETQISSVNENVLSQGLLAAFEALDTGETNNSLEYENLLMDMIERGDVQGVRGIRDSFFDFRSGKLADTPLKNHQKLCHTSLTLAARAAIRGGLDPQVAFQMSDRFIQQTEMVHTRDELHHLLIEALNSYTQMVFERQMPSTQDKLTKEVILYIREHVSDPLSVPGLSAHFGYSRDYLSQKFKKQLGIGLAAFIMQSRLEEAGRLLTYTSLSLREISEHLRFSDQSHFQNAFKKQYQVTPAAYREDKRRLRM